MTTKELVKLLFPLEELKLTYDVNQTNHIDKICDLVSSSKTYSNYDPQDKGYKLFAYKARTKVVDRVIKFPVGTFFNQLGCIDYNKLFYENALFFNVCLYTKNNKLSYIIEYQNNNTKVFLNKIVDTQHEYSLVSVTSYGVKEYICKNCGSVLQRCKTIDGKDKVIRLENFYLDCDLVNLLSI